LKLLLTSFALLSVIPPASAMPFFATASWYGPGFHGNRTANGEIYNQWANTVAHKSLPFGTRVRVTNTANGRSLIVRVNDRGPFWGHRDFDLSRGAAERLGIIEQGVAELQFDILPESAEVQ